MRFKKTNKGEYNFVFSRAEALVLFEFLSRNWDKGNWLKDEIVSDVSERDILVTLEAFLVRELTEPLDENYKIIIERAYRSVIPNPEEY